MALYRPPYGMGGLGGLGSPMDPTGMLHHRLPAYPGMILIFGGVSVAFLSLLISYYQINLTMSVQPHFRQWD